MWCKFTINDESSMSKRMFFMVKSEFC